MKLERLFEIVYLLLYKKQVTAKELASYFEVSTRTIYRDIESLSLAGIPIYSTKGRGGGIRLTENFVLDKLLLSKEEQEQLLLGLENLSRTGIDVTAIQNKLKGAFQTQTVDWLEIDFSQWGNSSGLEEKFETLKLAILQKRAVVFTYHSGKGEMTHRTVLPIRLIFKGRDWYLYAYCLEKKANRMFKLSRLHKLDKGEYLGDWPPETQRDMERIEVPYQANHYGEITLRFPSSIAYRIYDEYPPDDIVSDDTGNLTVTLILPIDEWIYHYILSFGHEVEVIEPKEVREEVRRRIEKLRENYNK